MKIEEVIYKIPLRKDIIVQIPSLELFTAECYYCKVTPLENLSTLKELCMVVVYDFFDINIKNSPDLRSLEEKKLLFGKVLCEKISTRGKDKFLKYGSIITNVEIKDLPYLRYNSSFSGRIDGNWFYIEPAEYYAIHGKRTELTKVRSLETLSVYTESIVKLRIIIELLKRNVASGLITLTTAELIKIGCFYLNSETIFKNIDTETLELGVTNWVNEMWLTQLYDK